MAPKPVPAYDVAGTWTATGIGSSKYAMSLKNDGAFTRSFTRRSRKQEVKGVYTLEGNVLAMEPDGGGVMLAEVMVNAPDSLHFKLIGRTADDPGLEFRRGQPR